MGVSSVSLVKFIKQMFYKVPSWILYLAKAPFVSNKYKCRKTEFQENGEENVKFVNITTQRPLEKMNSVDVSPFTTSACRQLF